MTGLTKADEGKPVLDAEGAEVGRLLAVADGRGYVEPEPTVADAIRMRLGWGTATDGTHPVDGGSVARITDDAIHLRGTF